MATYRLHAHDGDDLGLLEHPAPNVEPGDIVMLADGREALVTARVEARPGPLEALLEVIPWPPLLTSGNGSVGEGGEARGGQGSARV